ncbi:MAG: MFS transporter [Ignavibacteria bacterium]|nr:MFS transporter [Ignavibacteria bacterium]
MDSPVKRNVFHYFISDISVFVSVYLNFLTMVWLTYELTGSSADLGLVGFVQNVPFFLFSVLGGVVADNYNRRKIVVRFNIVFVILAFVVALTAFLKFLTFPLILVFSFLLGAFYSIYYPSMIAMVQDMVTDNDEFPHYGSRRLKCKDRAASRLILFQLFDIRIYSNRNIRHGIYL